MQAHSLSNIASLSSPLSLPPTETPTDQPLAASPRGLAHDAGNLLGALALYADLLHAPGVLRPEHHHYAEELRVLAHRGTLLVSRWQEACGGSPLLSTWPRSGFGQADAAASLRTLVPVLERMAGPAARIVLQAPHVLSNFPLGVEALERVVINLVRNASAALIAQGRSFRRRGHIRVALTANPSLSSLTVEDDGPGLDAAIAERFLRPAEFPADAHGLGLRIVHELTAGAVREVFVRPRHGTTFVFTWPRAAARREEASAC